MAYTSPPCYVALMRNGIAVDLQNSTALAVRVLLYRYRVGEKGRGGHRDLLKATRRTRVDLRALRARLTPGRYRLEWRSAFGRVLRVRAFRVRSPPAEPCKISSRPVRPSATARHVKVPETYVKVPRTFTSPTEPPVPPPPTIPEDRAVGHEARATPPAPVETETVRSVGHRGVTQSEEERVERLLRELRELSALLRSR